MGEQFTDLFAAGAYATLARLYEALARPELSWIFYLLAAAGLLHAIVLSALEQRPDFWLRHLLAVAVAAVLTIAPRSVDLRSLTYGAPGAIENAFDTRTGAAPHLTYWIERLGGEASLALARIIGADARLVVPGVAQQVERITADPGYLDDAQLKTNLDIWRRRIVPSVLQSHPAFEAAIEQGELSSSLLAPAPAVDAVIGPAEAERQRAVRRLLDGLAVDPAHLLASLPEALATVAADAGASPWTTPDDARAPVEIRLVVGVAWAPASDQVMEPMGWTDAMRRADSVGTTLRGLLPGAERPHPVRSLSEMHDLLGASIFYVAGTRLRRDRTARAAVGALCQQIKESGCLRAMAPFRETSRMLRVPGRDAFNSSSTTTWLRQPLASLLLTVTSLLMETLSSLVVSVLPFALGVAKAIAIVISALGPWMLLWPGRVRLAVSWMVGPISFVSVWGVLFNLWTQLDPLLQQVASVAGAAPGGSISAQRAMAIAIALGYMGLPSLALGIVYGESGRALYHASARVENALLMAWHTRGSILAFGRRWLVNSPLARRWNQRVYRAIGLGALQRAPSARAGARSPRPKKPRTPKPAAGS